jgi:hypothetical protein
VVSAYLGKSPETGEDAIATDSVGPGIAKNCRSPTDPDHVR